jgi:hypothetical protein
LKITEVSSVDRGAGDGVKILLMKRDDTDGDLRGQGGQRAEMGDPSGAFVRLCAAYARNEKISLGEAQKVVLSTPTGKALFAAAKAHDQRRNA